MATLNEMGEIKLRVITMNVGSGKKKEKQPQQQTSSRRTGNTSLDDYRLSTGEVTEVFTNKTDMKACAVQDVQAMKSPDILMLQEYDNLKPYNVVGQRDAGVGIKYNGKKIKILCPSLEKIGRKYKYSMLSFLGSLRIDGCEMEMINAPGKPFIVISWHGPNNAPNNGEGATMKVAEKKKYLGLLIEHLKQLKEHIKIPILIGGDFNIKITAMLDDMQQYKPFMLKDYTASPRRMKKGVIDYFIYTDDLKLRKCKCVDLKEATGVSCPEELFDHDPVIATVVFKHSVKFEQECLQSSNQDKRKRKKTDEYDGKSKKRKQSVEDESAGRKKEEVVSPAKIHQGKLAFDKPKETHKRSDLKKTKETNRGKMESQTERKRLSTSSKHRQADKKLQEETITAKTALNSPDSKAKNAKDARSVNNQNVDDDFSNTSPHQDDKLPPRVSTSQEKRSKLYKIPKLKEGRESSAKKTTTAYQEELQNSYSRGPSNSSGPHDMNTRGSNISSGPHDPNVRRLKIPSLKGPRHIDSPRGISDPVSLFPGEPQNRSRGQSPPQAETYLDKNNDARFRSFANTSDEVSDPGPMVQPTTSGIPSVCRNQGYHYQEMPVKDPRQRPRLGPFIQTKRIPADLPLPNFKLTEKQAPGSTSPNSRGGEITAGDIPKPSVHAPATHKEFDILLLNDETPLGFHIEACFDKENRPNGMMVQSIEPGGRIHRDGRLNIQDRIIEINGIDLRCIAFSEAHAFLRNAMKTHEVRMKVVQHSVPPLPPPPPHNLLPKPEGNSTVKPNPLTLAPQFLEPGSRLTCPDQTSTDLGQKQNTPFSETVKKNIPQGAKESVSGFQSAGQSGNVMLSPGNRVIHVPPERSSPTTLSAVAENTCDYENEDGNKSLSGTSTKKREIITAPTNTKECVDKELELGPTGSGFNVTTRDNTSGGPSPIYTESILPIDVAVDDARLTTGDRLPEAEVSQAQGVATSQDSYEGVVAAYDTTKPPVPAPAKQKKVGILLCFTNNGAPLGFSVKEAFDQKGRESGMLVHDKEPGGRIDLDGRLKVQDRIIEINGHDLNGITFPNAQDILRNAMKTHEVRMKVVQHSVPPLPPPPPPPPALLSKPQGNSPVKPILLTLDLQSLDPSSQQTGSDQTSTAKYHKQNTSSSETGIATGLENAKDSLSCLHPARQSGNQPKSPRKRTRLAPPVRSPSRTLSATAEKTNDDEISEDANMFMSRTSAKHVKANLPTTNSNEFVDKEELELVKGPTGSGFNVTTRDTTSGGPSPIYTKNILPKVAAVDDARLTTRDNTSGGPSPIYTESILPIDVAVDDARLTAGYRLPELTEKQAPGSTSPNSRGGEITAGDILKPSVHAPATHKAHAILRNAMKTYEVRMKVVQHSVPPLPPPPPPPPMLSKPQGNSPVKPNLLTLDLQSLDPSSQQTGSDQTNTAKYHKQNTPSSETGIATGLENAKDSLSCFHPARQSGNQPMSPRKRTRLAPPVRSPSRTLSATAEKTNDDEISEDANMFMSRTSAKHVKANLPTTNSNEFVDKEELELVKGPTGSGFTVTTRDTTSGGPSPIYTKNILPKVAAVDDARLTTRDNTSGGPSPIYTESILPIDVADDDARLTTGDRLPETSGTTPAKDYEAEGVQRAVDTILSSVSVPPAVHPGFLSDMPHTGPEGPLLPYAAPPPRFSHYPQAGIPRGPPLHQLNIPKPLSVGIQHQPGLSPYQVGLQPRPLSLPLTGAPPSRPNIPTPLSWPLDPKPPLEFMEEMRPLRARSRSPRRRRSFSPITNWSPSRITRSPRTISRSPSTRSRSPSTRWSQSRRSRSPSTRWSPSRRSRSSSTRCLPSTRSRSPNRRSSSPSRGPRTRSRRSRSRSRGCNYSRCLNSPYRRSPHPVRRRSSLSRRISHAMSTSKHNSHRRSQPSSSSRPSNSSDLRHKLQAKRQAEKARESDRSRER